MKKLLIGGGGYADIPLIQAAQKLGYFVITTGNRPDELGHAESDAYRPCDFSDPEAMLRLAMDEKIDAICACCNDFSATSCAFVAQQLGLPGHDPYLISKQLHHKDAFRNFCQTHGIPSPKAQSFESLTSALKEIDDFSLPFMIKPVDLTGGKGVEKVEAKANVKKYLEQAFAISRVGRVVIEEFVEGSHHGLSAFLRKGKVVFSLCDNEHYYLNRYMVAAASTPSTVAHSVVEALIQQIEKIASLLSLVDGIFHVQFVLRQGEPIIIEACRRAPGDLYVRFVEYATGVEYASWIVKASAGLDCSGLGQKEVQGFVTRHCIMGNRSGVLETVEFDPTVRNFIFDRMEWWKPGDRVLNHLTNKFGIVFLRFNSLQEMLSKTESMPGLIVAKINSA